MQDSLVVGYSPVGTAKQVANFRSKLVRQGIGLVIFAVIVGAMYVFFRRSEQGGFGFSYITLALGGFYLGWFVVTAVSLIMAKRRLSRIEQGTAFVVERHGVWVDERALGVRKRRRGRSRAQRPSASPNDSGTMRDSSATEATSSAQPTFAPAMIGAGETVPHADQPAHPTSHGGSNPSALHHPASNPAGPNPPDPYGPSDPYVEAQANAPLSQTPSPQALDAVPPTPLVFYPWSEVSDMRAAGRDFGAGPRLSIDLGQQQQWRVPISWLDTMLGTIDGAVRVYSRGNIQLDVHPLDSI